MALLLAAQLGPHGALHLVEPRWLCAQKAAADAPALGLANLHIWPALAAEITGRRKIPNFDPASLSHPGAWGNVAQLVPVSAIVIYALGVDRCRSLVVLLPQDLRETLRGATELMCRARPIILGGPLIEAHRAEIEASCANMDYSWSLTRVAEAAASPSLMIGVPRESAIVLKGLEPL